MPRKLKKSGAALAGGLPSAPQISWRNGLLTCDTGLISPSNMRRLETGLRTIQRAISSGDVDFEIFVRSPPSVREQFLEGNFTKQPEAERWNPLKAR